MAEDGNRERAERAGDGAGAQRAPEDAARRGVLVLGGGLIGGALVDALAARGHRVVLGTRSGRGRAGASASVAVDLATPPSGDALQALFEGVEVVVNTVGIFRASAQQDFDAVHVNGPRRVFEAARAAGVRRVVQLSALGADVRSPLPYFASKGRLDAWLLQGGGEAAVVRPSLVFGPEGASTRWFAQLASLPITPLPGDGGQLVQPVHLDDVVEALVKVVERPAVPAVLDAVGPRALPLRGYLSLFKAAMGAGRAFVAMPMWLVRPMATLASRASRSLPLDADALAMLDAGSTADAAPFERWLGRPPRDPPAFMGPAQAAAMRQAAVLAWTLPTMRLALAAMWVATGVVSLWAYPREASMAMLAEVGLHGGLATAALWAGALADMALGVALLVVSRRMPVYLLQLALVATYTVIITIWLPGQWAHPFGPVLKNVPLLAMILALLMLDRTHGPDPR